MVVGDEDAGLQRNAHDASELMGIESVISVPRPGWLLIPSCAPKSMARSRMPRIPCDEGSAPAQAATVVADDQHGPVPFW